MQVSLKFKEMKRFLILSLFIGFVFSANIFSQVNNFKIYSIDQGLPVSTVFTMIRDSRGYLWLGTIGGGVSRFDGYSFLTFNQKSGLPDNNVRTILEDSKGNFWFGTYGGIGFYDGYTIRNINKDDGLSGEQVWSLFEDRKNTVWAGTDNALNKVEFFNSYDSIKITSYSLMEGLAARLIFDIYEDKYDRLWLATYRNGIYIVSFENEEISNVKRLSSGGIPSDNILDIEEDKEGNLWFATEDEGVFKIEGFTDSSWGQIKVYNSSNGLPDNMIWDILSDEAGNLWFATDKGGIVKLVNNEFMEYSVKQGFPENQVLCIEQDNEGNIWAGTFSFGIVKMMGDHFSHYMEEQGLSSNQVYDIDQDEQGNYWLASLGAGLIRLSFKNGAPDFKYYTTQDGLPDNYIVSLSFDTKGNLWIGTQENGISRFDGKKFVNYSVDNGLIDNRVICMLADSRGDVWIGTKSRISRYNGIGFFPITAEEFGLPHNEIQTIIEDNEGRIWVGTYDGLARFENNIMQTFGEEEGLDFKQIFALAEDINGNIWIGTHGGGLYKWNKNADLKQSIKFIVGDSLLGSNIIVSMVFQDDSTLLVGTNVGFDKIILDKDQNIQQVKNYNKSNGFIGMENNMNAILKDSEENIWFGTVKGITRFNPMLEKINLTPPKLHLTELDLEFENIDWSEKVDSILPYSLLPFDLKLPHHQNHLTFKWTGIYLGNPEKVSYKYKLDPQEKDWSPPRIMSEMTYSGLNPGEYTFMVIAENENGIWNKEPLTFNFIIKPPFYQTWWFITLMIFVAIIAIIAFIKYREKQLIKGKRILEQKVEERTLQIEHQKEEILAASEELEHKKEEIESQRDELAQTLENLERTQSQLVESEKMAALGGLVTGVAHEINTPVGIGITAISSWIDETKRMAELYKKEQITRADFKEYLTSSNDSAKLALKNLERTASLVQSFKQVSVDQSTEQQREFNLKSYMEDVIRSLYPKFKQRDIEINIDCDEELKLNSYPGAFAQIFTNLILNSLTHGFKEKEKGKISIDARKSNAELKIEYRDDGKGIPEEILPKVFDPFITSDQSKGTGLGLHIVYNLVTQKLKGTIKCDSELGKGTIMTINLPITKTK